MTTATLPDEVRRRELATFLRNRRERLTPEQVGLPEGGRRRTPGLRREEVATLAGVGVTWYTWLEQGRDIRASEQVLGAIAGTLRLDPYERTHLFTLAGVSAPTKQPDCTAVPAGMQAVLRKLEPFPATVQNARYDILAWNRSYDELMGGVSDLPFEDRNSLLILFTNTEFRRRALTWAESAPQMVAQFRASLAEHLTEPCWKALLKRLKHESPEFARMWQAHEVRPARNHTKTFRHPQAGVLRFDYTNLWTGQRSGLRMTTYAPADEETEQRLDLLLQLAISAGRSVGPTPPATASP
jgi:transcriptional regulator with XRE-family HTH domain